MKPIVGLPACTGQFGEHLTHPVLARYTAALLGGVGAVPVLIPPIGDSAIALLDRIDGLLLTGSPSNVHPDHYAGGDSRTPDFHDHDRDATTLPLIREAVRRGLP